MNIGTLLGMKTRKLWKYMQRGELQKYTKQL
jgi:hypothetical protein